MVMRVVIMSMIPSSFAFSNISICPAWNMSQQPAIVMIDDNDGDDDDADSEYDDYDYTWLPAKYTT